MRFPVIVAAAGGSTRCPEGKLLKLWQGRPLLDWLLGTLSGHPRLGPLVVVTGHLRSQVEKLAQTYPDVHTRFNPDWKEGLSTSLRVGEWALPPGEGFLVALGDTPLFSLQTLEAVLPSQDLVRVRIPLHGQREGHPVFFPEWMRAHWPELSGDRGARPLLSRWPELVERVPVDDSGVLRDFDQASDFEAH